MKSEIYNSMAREAERYWWARARRELVRALWSRYRNGPKVGRPAVLDVGCGTGELLRELAGEAEAYGIDGSEMALDYCRRRGATQILRVDLESEDAAGAFGRRFDAVFALDVLEHVEHDSILVDRMYDALSPGGLCIVTVPAFSALWSRRDEDLGHKRRYTRAEISRLFPHGRWKKLRLTHCMFVLSPVLAMGLWLERRGLPKPSWMASEMQSYAPMTSTLLLTVLRAENRWLLRAGFPWGVSIVGVWERIGQAARSTMPVTTTMALPRVRS